jgi:hypothetical protein
MLSTVYTQNDLPVQKMTPTNSLRYAGWGRHLICSKRFHFVLPKRESLVEADGLHYGINNVWEKTSKGTAASRGHLLHGVVHLNGYGHLVSIHGFEGGSDCVSGRQIMDLWDRICSALHVRCAMQRQLKQAVCKEERSLCPIRHMSDSCLVPLHLQEGLASSTRRGRGTWS